MIVSETGADWRRTSVQVLFCILSAFLLYPAMGAGVMAIDKVTISEQRQVSNDAILNRKIDVLKSSWLPELHVTGSNGQVVNSSDEMAEIFQRLFKNPEFITFIRTPVDISISPGGKMGAESGEWIGRWKKSDGKMIVAGTYLAQWRKHKGEWKIRSEVFIALSCEGSSSCEELP